MKLLLPALKVEINYGVKHLETTTAFTGVAITSRGTRVWVKIPDSTIEIIGEAFCHPNDNFCKRIGRKMAATRLLAQLNWIPKQDRKAIFEAICPEYKTEKV